MSEWQHRLLGEALDVYHGWTFKGEFFAESGELIVLTPGNFKDAGGFKSKSGAEKFYRGDFPEKYLLHKGAVVVAMTEQAQGLLGSTATIPEANRYLHNQRIGLLQVTDPTVLDLRFTYHLMNTPDVRRQIQATATGSKVRHTAPGRIRDIAVRLPGIPAQRVIADILDSIDDLIENNRRRVEVLEEMARGVYREWFVKFRYPGHGDVPQVDSALGPIPEGWDVGSVDSHVFLQRGFDLPTKDRAPGPVNVMGASGVQGTHDVAKVVGPCVTTGRSGTVGVVHYVPEDFWPLNTSLWVKEFRLATPRYAYFLLDDLDLRRSASGAAVPTLDRKVVHAMPAVCPPADLIAQWDDVVLPMFEERVVLRRQSTSLIGVRDLLLPKLVTGQTDVSTLDLDALVSTESTGEGAVA